MRTVNQNNWKFFTVAMSAILLSGAQLAHAQISDFSLFWSDTFSQTNGTTVTPTGAYFSARGFFTNPGDFDGGTLTYPGPGSPAGLSPVSTPAPGYLNYQTGLYPSQAAMDADFPAGTYDMEATDSTGTNLPQDIEQNYTGTAYPLSVPALTANTFNGLQGLDPSHDFTVAFNQFLTNSLANNEFIFFDIFPLAGNSVFDESFADPTVQSFDVPADTLLPDTAYTYQLIFSSRIDVTDDTLLEQGFDYRTVGGFETGDVPEPASIGLVGLAAMALSMRRKAGR
jgi:PEP-CTERM motif